MSRLTASPFHKPPPFKFPRPLHPLSPPDTDSDPGAPMQPTSISGSNSMILGAEFDQTAPQLPAQAESPAARFKRVSTLTYHNSGLREPRERSTSKTSKSLVVIIPPEHFSQEHGQLGHTLSSGPQNRLSHGILMPLFPTMYGQLTAIAREFNFPSTAGVCLYLHISDNGFTVTPRISDESWQFLWGHLLQGSTPTPGPHGLPISGRIEFDVDMDKARWYGSWISSSHRDTAEHIPLSHTPSLSHWRGESKTSFVTDQMDDEHQESSMVIQQTQTPASTIRNIPRKLSLVDRFESFSTPPASRPASRMATLLGEPVEQLEAQIISDLSPIIQADEPPTAKQNLEKKVKSWRASASSVPTPLVLSGETTVEADNVPINVSVDDALAEDTSSELNLDDFTWSVSSAGPPSNDSESPLPSGSFLSVHLGDRGDFSKPVTPLTATSWGAPSNDPDSPLSSGRLLSVHLGDRGEFSRPVTPSTATTWGAPISYPPTPNMPSHVHTPDAGQRAFDPYDPAPIRYVTFKGTPWRHVWPYHHAQSHDCDISNEIHESESASRYPYLNIYPSVYPYFDLYPAVSIVEVESMTSKCLSTKLQATYPVFDIYPASYPHFDIYHTVSSMTVTAVETLGVSQPQSLTPITTTLPVTYPDYNLYPPVYPANLDVIYPSLAVEEVRSTPSVKLAVQYPQFDLYPSVYPFITPYPIHVAPSSNFGPDSDADLPDIQEHQTLSVSVEVAYPVFNLYPAIYPDFDIYPNLVDFDFDSPFSPMDNTQNSVRAYLDFDISIMGLQKQNGLHCEKSLPVKLDVLYPAFDIYPPVYPTIDLYPAVRMLGESVRDVQSKRTIPSEQVSGGSYPNLCVYPAVYPHFDIYPPSFVAEVESMTSKCLPTELQAIYPDFDIYPASWITITAIETLAVSQLQSPTPITTTLPVTYPNFDLYPAVYPANLDVIYPSIAVEDDLSPPSVKLAMQYPQFDLYPSVYPYIMPYPIHVDSSGGFIPDSVAGSLDLQDHEKPFFVSVEVAYPVFNIYPAMYPDFDIYPSLVEFDSPFSPKDDMWNSDYANPDFYPATISLQNQDCLDEKSLSLHLDVVYPAFDLYPPVYPTIELYAAIHTPDEVRDMQSKWALSSEQVSGSSLSVRLDCSYPNLCIYPAVYPFFELYPTLSAGLKDQQVEICPSFGLHSRQDEDRSSSLSTRLPANYPAFDLYPALYPYFDLYPWRYTSTALVNDMRVPTLSKVPKIEDEIRSKADRTQSLSRDSSASELTVRKSRTRSGTVTGRTAAPTLGKVERPSLPATSVHRPSTIALSPQTATRRPPPQTDGLPTNTAVTRRPLPSQHVSLLMPKTAVSSGESVDVVQGHVHPSLSRVDEHPTPKIASVMRTRSMALPPKPVNGHQAGIDRSRSLSSRPRPPRKRDSLVLTRAKAFEASSARQNPESSIS